VTPSKDTRLINSYANHPDIRPFIGGVGELDLSAAAYDPHVALFGEFGGFVLTWTAPETYEVHTLILPEGRGQWAFGFAKEAIAHMVGLGASHLWTRVKTDHRHTALFTRKMGFRPCGQLLTSFTGEEPEIYNLFNWRMPCQQQ
jgi:hypothetical protein